MRGGEPFWLRQKKGSAAAAKVMEAVLWRALHPYTRGEGYGQSWKPQRGG